MIDDSLIGQLITALRCLPGVGPKSAQRMAFHLLERDRAGARRLAQTLSLAADNVGHCVSCRTLTELETCRLCANNGRDRTCVCVVEMPGDVQAIERSGTYKGLYFVLMGHLSPLDGIGPREIGLHVTWHLHYTYTGAVTATVSAQTAYLQFGQGAA